MRARFLSRSALLHERVAHAVGLAAGLDKPAVVDDAVDNGHRHLIVAEHRPRAAELQVGGDHGRPPLVSIGERLEQLPSALGVERQEP